MPLAMARPMKRPGTRNEQFVQRLPADVMDKVRGMRLVVPLGSETVNITISQTLPDIRFSLRTADPVEAKARHNAASAHLAGVWQSVRQGPTPLTHREITALSGLIYSDMTGLADDEPGESSTWDTFLHMHNHAKEAGHLERWLGVWVDKVLTRERLTVDETSRKRLLDATYDSIEQAWKVNRRKAERDYRPDPDAVRFPEWVAKNAAPVAAKSASTGMTLIDLLTKQAAERAYSPKTVSEWTRSLKSLAESAGTSIASEITPDHMIAWTDALVAKGLSAKTINETYLAAAKAVFRWAKSKRFIPINPALEAPKVSRRGDDEEGKRGFTVAEARVVLTASMKETTPARRWATWLLAHTGARAGEIMQLRRQDVKQEPESGIWYLDISPAAGRLKNKPSARVVPVHSQLIDLGFLEWVTAQPNNRLFYEEREGEALDGKRSRKSVAVNRLGDWVRGLGLPGVLSGEVSPNHGWRHRFITEMSNREITETVRKRITGHALEGQDNRYVGQIVMERLQSAVERMPSYSIS